MGRQFIFGVIRLKFHNFSAYCNSGGLKEHYTSALLRGSVCSVFRLGSVFAFLTRSLLQFQNEAQLGRHSGDVSWQRDNARGIASSIPTDFRIDKKTVSYSDTTPSSCKDYTQGHGSKVTHLHWARPTEPRFGITMTTHVKKANSDHHRVFSASQDNFREHVFLSAALRCIS